LFSFVGAGIGVLLVFLVGAYSKGGLTPSKLALAGTAIGMLLSSFATIIALQSNISKDVTYWYAGGLVGVEWQIIKVIAPIAVIGLIISLFISKSLTVISFGEDVAVGLGTNIRATKTIANICVLLLTGTAVSMVGYVGFVGLIVPHVARFFVGTDYRQILPCSAILGAILVLIADILARKISPPAEIPVSILTTLVGVPFFVYLASKTRRSSL
jgi:iron complex transport system permease protein